MLYEIIGIVRPGNLAEVKEIVLTAGQIILRQGGVIRDIRNWGVYLLPKPLSRAQQRHTKGHHFIMRFDSSARVQDMVREKMRLDVRVIRTACVKLGDGKLDTLSRRTNIEWNKLEM